MKVLVIGSGGREHAIVWKLSKSDKVSKIYAWPGNAGIAELAECVDGNVLDIKGISEFAQKNSIDLTIVGPESPLIIGIVDELESKGIKVFGPNKAAAQMEGSKVFAKRIMKAANVPTAAYEEFSDANEACNYINSLTCCSDPIVIKADGEAAGKGVIIAKSKSEALDAIDLIMNQKAFGDSGNKVIIEEFLDGQEATFMCIVDGENFVPLIASQDHKRAFDNDEGPNTGGMGCYSPVPVFDSKTQDYVVENIVKPTLKELKKQGIYYKGVLYVGLALTSKGPKVVEFNARFGDPETQVVLPLMESDFFDITLAVAEGRLDTTSVKWYNRCAVCVVMASSGYPGSYNKGIEIKNIDNAAKTGAIVFHAGTDIKDGKLVTAGGRVLGITGLGESYREAIDNAYKAVDLISFDNSHVRRDIGKRLL